MPTIRPAEPADAPGMARCVVDSWLAAHHGQIPEALWEKRRDEWTYDVSAASWRATLVDPTGAPGAGVVLVAEGPTGRIIGVAMGRPGDGADVGEISVLYVLPSEQGCGLGRRLLESTAAELSDQGRPVLRIAVLAANAAARGFYEHLGGRVVDERDFDEEGTLLPEVVYGWP